MTTICKKPSGFPAASTRYGKTPAGHAFAPTVGETVPIESVEFVEEGRRLITSPIPAPQRPVTTVMPPPAATPPRTAGGMGRVGQPLPPGRLPPVGPRPAAISAAPRPMPRPVAAAQPRKIVPPQPTMPDDIPY